MENSPSKLAHLQDHWTNGQADLHHKDSEDSGEDYWCRCCVRNAFVRIMWRSAGSCTSCGPCCICAAHNLAVLTVPAMPPGFEDSTTPEAAEKNALEVLSRQQVHLQRAQYCAGHMAC